MKMGRGVLLKKSLTFLASRQIYFTLNSSATNNYRKLLGVKSWMQLDDSHREI